jgi:hypothetical protein
MSAQLNADIMVKLTLTRKPEQRDKSTGGKYTLAKGREGVGEGARFFSLFVYSETARAEIDRLDVGDVVTVHGSFDVSIWDGRGKPQISLKINVDRALALKKPPRTRKPKPTGEEVARQSWAAPAQMAEYPVNNGLASQTSKREGAPNDSIPW